MPGALFARDGDVSLRTVEADDLDFLEANRNHPSIRAPIASPEPRNRAQWSDIFEDGISSDDGYHFLICDESGGSADASEDGSAGRPAARDNDAAVGDSNAAAGDNEAGPEPEPVGVVAIPYIQQPASTGMLMYWVAPDHRGKGYVTTGTELILEYVFREQGLHKVWAMVIEPNEPSQAVLEKLGFQREGRHRSEVYYEGDHVDSYRYGILAREWLAD